MRIERASRVDEQSAGLQTFPYIAHNFALQLPAVVHILLAPFRSCTVVLAKHSLARARHVGKYCVEHDASLAIVARIVVGYDDVFVSELLQVFAQYLCTGAHRFVREEHRSFGKGCTQGCRLASRCCTEVEHAHGLVDECAHNVVYYHRSGFLHIVQSGMQQRVEGEVGAFAQIASGGAAPWYGAVV